MISIVICSINPVNFTRISAQYHAAMGAEPHEIIGIHDAKSLCEGYNRGLARSTGDIVIFSHDDIEIWTPHFTQRLKAHLQNFDVVGVAGTNRLVGPNWYQAGPPYAFGQVAHVIPNGFHVAVYGAPRRVVGNIQAMDGLFLAFRRDAIERVRWDEQTFNGFHCYDVDCTYRAYLSGLRLAVALDLPMLHLSHGEYGDTWQQYAHRFTQKHAATLGTIGPRNGQCTFIQVPTREEAIVVMNDIVEQLG